MKKDKLFNLAELDKIILGNKNRLEESEKIIKKLEEETRKISLKEEDSEEKFIIFPNKSFFDFFNFFSNSINSGL